NNHDTRAHLFIAIVEVPAAQKWSTHRFKVTRRDDDLHWRNHGFPGLHLVAFSEDYAVAVIPAEWNDRGSSRTRDARDTANALEHAIDKQAHIVVGGIADTRHPNARRDDAVRFEAGIHCNQISKAGQKQSRANQQHKREPNLSD